MKKSLLIVGILMTTYTNVLPETQWTTPVNNEGKYAEKLNMWIKLEVPNAKAITVTINGETERTYDHVYI